uniref:Metalloendopeptidase n=1 Tax=Caenorhabditis tropicalis TaxID=1561998 RepID=A0A1I7UIR4_9PELO
MHALGFEHQMSRIDRDKYLFINWANIKDDLEYNFYMVDDGQVMSVPYDYGSVMHYGAYHFAENPKIPSMVAYNPLFQYTIGNSQQPSFSDILAVNRLYNCTLTFEPKICNWHIKAPAGKRVELKIIKGGECNCYFTSLEINLGKFNSYGMTVCCYYFDNQVVLSEGNLVALRGFIRFDRLAVTLQYRAI